MCDVMTGLAIASAAFGLVGQEQAASAQNKFNDQQRTNAITANNQQNAQISQKQLQDRDAATQKVMTNNIAAQKAMATASVSAGSAGISGLSVGSLLDDLGSSQGRYNNSVDENLRSSYMADDNSRVNSYNSMKSTINSLKAPAMPNYLGTALQIGTALDGYNTKSGGAMWDL
jgi:uncharacterized protein YlxW (UPF0749 family)